MIAVKSSRVCGKRIITYLQLCSKLVLSEIDGSIRLAIFLSQSVQFPQINYFSWEIYIGFITIDC